MVIMRNLLEVVKVFCCSSEQLPSNLPSRQYNLHYLLSSSVDNAVAPTPLVKLEKILQARQSQRDKGFRKPAPYVLSIMNEHW
jgi:hypothetical protein